MEDDEDRSCVGASPTAQSDLPHSMARTENSGKINCSTEYEQTSVEHCSSTEESSERAQGPGSISSPCHHYLMTTKELQLYWSKEKHERKPVKLLFEIPSTRIAEDFLSKFVVYKIIIVSTGSFDENKVFIERRYSDFEKLHRNLLKYFKEEMEDVLFPKKILMGNLTEELIRKRILALKDYLAELYTISCVRKSKKFMEFFTKPEEEEGYSCLRGGEYGRATELFHQVVCLKERLTLHCPAVVVPSMCALVVCHKDMDNLDKAYEVGMKALTILEKHTVHRYYVPLLDTLISLAYKIGKDFMSLRERLEKEERKVNIEHMSVSLKELAVQECIE
ncbi:sorting nexin-20 [Pelobates cultripes]|uniref:Sorting nexin-20 n=1 Tax=Pelobates cultripes TaxID=61616 RepID=A0AAD1TJ96_PELCU|nr:sorting nexin-20 [Pelobates cultripes]